MRARLAWQRRPCPTGLGQRAAPPLGQKRASRGSAILLCDKRHARPQWHVAAMTVDRARAEEICATREKGLGAENSMGQVGYFRAWCIILSNKIAQKPLALLGDRSVTVSALSA